MPFHLLVEDGRSEALELVNGGGSTGRLGGDQRVGM